VRGCLLGGAIGDALGAPVEFLTLAEITGRFGPDGIANYAPAYGRIGAITDDTQMTLFTAEGMIRAYVRKSLKGICSVPGVVCHAYLRWLLTQGLTPKVEVRPDGWLWNLEALHSRRAPGKTCLSALAAMKHFSADRATNNSKGAGAIMRVAPAALTVADGGEKAACQVFTCAKSISWLTHGHPTGYLSAAAFAVIIHALLWRQPIAVGTERALRLLGMEQDADETSRAISGALTAVSSGEAPEVVIQAIGGGWVAEEALAISLYCASFSRDFATAVRMAVNHGGDSDTTGLLAGQLVGAIGGEEALPDSWLRELELRDAISTIADDLSEFLHWSMADENVADAVWERYPGW
jgi:ADP-ribosylglycohydrolase